MLTETTPTLPTQAHPQHTPSPRKAHFEDPNQTSTPTQSFHEPGLLFSPPSIRLQSSTNNDRDANSSMPQGREAEDEYTLSAYGDISLSEIIVPPLPAPAHPSVSPLQPRSPLPRLRLKVRRPPMPRHLLSYVYVPDPMPHSGRMEPDDDERWPGSPRSVITNSPPWSRHQSLVSPHPADTTISRAQGSKPVKNGGTSLEKLFDDLLPRSPSIRLSPPGSPASRALGLPQETREQKSSGVRQGRNVLEADGVAKPSQSIPAPAPRQDKPKSAAWRTRLPPRLPIPKWDM